jgi:hypothetical protein
VVSLVAATTTLAVLVLRSQYTFSLQSPVRVHFQWPLVVAAKTAGEDALEAQTDQFGRSLTAYQQYACNKFGSACRVALAIQRAENPKGACEIYHYNSDGTLDWGYFQINTVHLTRVGLNLRDLLDCRANIDFAYQLLPGARFPAMEHVQQRRLSQVLAKSLRRASAFHWGRRR